MKLRSRFVAIQFLFVALLFLAGGGSLSGQDRLVLTNGQTREGRVLGCDGRTIQLQFGAGAVGVPLNTVSRVTMAAPAELAAAQDAVAKGDYAGALGKTRALVDKYRGLPADWAEQAALMLGDIYVALKDHAKAEAAYKDFQTFYPQAGALRVEIGMARIAVARGDFAEAKAKLEPAASKALAVKNPAPQEAAAYGQLFYLLGQCREAESDYPGALQDYLRTVTIFPQDRLATAAAQERADVLRKEHKITVP